MSRARGPAGVGVAIAPAAWSGRGPRRLVGMLGLTAGIAAVATVSAGPPNPMPEGKARKETRYLFAAVPWLTPADSLAAALGPRGYKEVPGGRQKDRRQFEGRLFERWTMVTALLDDRGRLIRWEISIPAPSEPRRDAYASQRPLYDDAIAEMETKYGPRRSTLDQFRFPYWKGDGREVRALGEGLATIRSEWSGRGGDRLWVALDERVSLTLVYESPEWTAAEKERRRRKARDL
jgi:hypothetical protein